MNYFQIDDLKKKIVCAVLIIVGALLLGIGVAIVVERAQMGRGITEQSA